MSGLRDKMAPDDMSERIIETAGILAAADGAHTITVRKILQKLGITNRVFYNRFHNVDEVLSIVYERAILKIRDSVPAKLDTERDFFVQVMAMAEDIILKSYEIKRVFRHYVFEHDSLSKSNYEWWISEIKSLIEYAKENHYIKDVDSDMLSYSFWCFYCGYNADAVSRNISKEDAVKFFKYGFEMFGKGVMNK